MTSMIERGAEAMRARRRELIAQPLDRIWPDLMCAAIEAMLEPTEEMWGGLARDLVMWDRGIPDQYGSTLYKHLRAIGRDIPDWLLQEIPDIDHTPPKGAVAVSIFLAMISAALKEQP